jgi:outer membrane lipoprotein-sorting protein
VRRRALLLANLPLPALAQEDPALARTMAALAAVRQRRAAFVEDKTVPELDVPLRVEGTLSWSAPDRLERRVTAPIEERLVLDGARLTYERPDRGVRRDFALADQPEMGALVEAIRGTLAGDLAALRRHYEVEFATQRDGSWRVVLTPVSLRLRGAVQRITLTGQGAEVLGVETQANDGISRMRITSGS